MGICGVGFEVVGGERELWIFLLGSCSCGGCAGWIWCGEFIPSKAPPRAQVVKNLKNRIIINLLGMGATLLGLQATVGVLIAKALTSNAAPYFQGAQSNYSPVLALDVFLVQASGNAILAHFLGLVFSLELLRSVTLSSPPPELLKVA